VTLDQLREAGLTRQMVRNRVRKGRFAPVHRGVYQVGPRLSARAGDMAAVLSCGPRAVLSHRSAAALWELLPSPPGNRERGSLPEPPVCEISVCRSDRGVAAPWIVAHRVTTLGPRDRTLREALPVTTPLRTLLDLAALAARRPGTAGRDPLPPVARGELERAVSKAEREGLASLADLGSRLDEAPRRPGSALLRQLLDLDGGPAFTRSEAEARLLELVRSACLPPARTNARIGRYELDLFWQGASLAIEVDGYAFHRSRDRFEGDRVRDAELAALGIQVIRVTWRQIRDEPAAVLARLARALGRAESRKLR
jgi:very-short-patch-repair endonuclease